LIPPLRALKAGPTGRALLAYRYLTTFGENPSGAEIKAVANKTGLDEKAVAGMVEAAIRYPASHKQLMGAGYAESQIPVWIARPDGNSSPEEKPPEAAEAAVELEAPAPAGTSVDLPHLR